MTNDPLSEIKGPLYISSRSINDEVPVGHCLAVLQKLNTELPNDLAIPLLCIHLKRLKYTCSYKSLYTDIHSCIKHGKQKVATTHMLTS